MRIAEAFLFLCLFSILEEKSLNWNRFAGCTRTVVVVHCKAKKEREVKEEEEEVRKMQHKTPPVYYRLSICLQ